MKRIIILLFFSFIQVYLFGQDTDTYLQNTSWYTDKSLVNPKDQGEIWLYMSKNKPTDYEVKFLKNNDFYFSFVNDKVMFDETGKEIPVGTKNDFLKFQYRQLDHYKLKIFYKPEYVEPKKAEQIAIYYKIDLAKDGSILILTRINKQDFK